MKRVPDRPHFFVFALALISIGALAITARGLPLLAVFAIAIILSQYVNARLVDRTLMRMFLRIMLIALAITVTPENSNSGFDGFGPTRTRDLFGEICAAEIVVQFWRRRTYDPRRSALIILLMSGLTFLTASNTFEETFIRYITPVYLLCLALMAYDYRPRASDIRQSSTTRLALLLRGLAVGCVVFVGAIGYRATIVYRGALTDFGNRLILKSALEPEASGMAAQPSLGPTFGLRGSAERVLRITNFTGDEHLCGVCYDEYDHSRWGPPVNERHLQPITPTALLIPPRRTHGSVTEMQVTRLVNDNQLIYLPLSAASVDPGAVTNISQAIEDDSPLKIRARSPYEYTVAVSDDDHYQGILASTIDPEERDICLSVPDPADEPEMDNVQSLARRIAGKIPDVRARIEAVTNYLLTHHPYSLEYKGSGQYHEALVDFLCSTPPEAAHCEFFASSAAILLRYVGVPTRYVTGYFAHESESNGDVVVRQRDAHAWCQAWVDPIGWVTVEATPPSGRPDALAGQTPVEPWRKWWEWLQDKVQALSDSLANLSAAEFGGITLAVTGAGVVFLILRGYFSRWRAAQPGLAGSLYTSSADLTLEALSRRFEAVWKLRAGHPVPVNRSYSEYMRQLARSDEEIDRAIIGYADSFARIYETARFGGHNNDETTHDTLEALIKDMESSSH